MGYHQHQPPCAHAVLAYCKTCDVAYCTFCGREWGNGGWSYTWGGTTNFPLNPSYTTCGTSNITISDKGHAH